ncbi:ATPase SWSAP1 [Sceloporus undulatus]|uniref:ATPase SWSAP1 n=1 Tax=Sceloporus undulatus TaxID=8520 RepID=UPI001C4CD8B4|nr:ATPase SWSAP1 [Sceloporus undulatus]
MAGALMSALLGVGPGKQRRPLVVLGPSGSGRSALLFRAALVGSGVAPAPATVMFLSPHPLERLPCGEGDVDASVMQRIQFLYPPSFQLLFQVVANLQQTSCPTLVVLDGLEKYLSSCPGPSVAAQLVALLLDTVNHFSQKLSRMSLGCQLLVSMRFPGEAGEDTEYLSVVERYFEARLWLHPEAVEHAGSASHGVSKVTRARLSQTGSQDQEWLLRFEPEGKMKISPLPCKSEKDHGAASENDRPTGAEAQAFPPGS